MPLSDEQRKQVKLVVLKQVGAYVRRDIARKIIELAEIIIATEHERTRTKPSSN